MNMQHKTKSGIIIKEAGDTNIYISDRKEFIALMTQIGKRLIEESKKRDATKSTA